MAQLVEHILGKDEVISSILISSSSLVTGLSVSGEVVLTSPVFII